MNTEEQLKISVKRGDLAQFKKLSSNVDDESFATTGENGNNLAHLAVIYNQPELLQAIIDIADKLRLSILEHTNDSKFTPLECCFYTQLQKPSH